MTRHQLPLILTVTLLLALSSVVSAWAGPPTDQLRQGIDRVVQILRDPALAGDRQADERRAAIGRVAGEIFDFGDMAKRSLGQHWGGRTPVERVEFARLFAELIQRSYWRSTASRPWPGSAACSSRTTGACGVWACCS